ncbi:Glyoxalase/Bleomycin resistance protein/Dihydroxybiphenyl dioxygenase [Gymnopilus junonius]|uniref:Glyoxalase/Bleomycin resistance protein/Dihydroxybiphenyl dioxygenase n=1 Tax=Gymnopilus junonius TaxID=109634 RepID=A0A9P5NCE9_GYMJU|nr:Glyoxalase/Bleomycin resistance protein/Dihydroxybiphenyl dioxygenase [Gymnopilus junonius]
MLSTKGPCTMPLILHNSDLPKCSGQDINRKKGVRNSCHPHGEVKWALRVWVIELMKFTLRSSPSYDPFLVQGRHYDKKYSTHNYYDTNPERRSLLGHISFGIPSLSTAEPFYTAIFAPLGITLVYKSTSSGSPNALGYGWGSREPFNLFETTNAAPHGKGTHLAFNAPSRKAVDEFYAAALENGGKGDGDPGVRKEIHGNYYACFVYDPFGHRLEAVFQDEVREEEEV